MESLQIDAQLSLVKFWFIHEDATSLNDHDLESPVHQQVFLRLTSSKVNGKHAVCIVCHTSFLTVEPTS